MDVLNSYELLQAKQQDVYDALKKRFNFLSIVRFLLVFAILFVGYILIVKTSNIYIWSVLIALIGSFLFVLNLHTKIAFKLSFSKELIQINKDEIDFLNGKSVAFENGKKFLEVKHMYSFDIDIFGHKSLYQHLNRTATFIGQNNLATLLNKKSDKETILQNQDSIKELESKIEWRQDLLAYAKIAEDDEMKYKTLINWVNKESVSVPKWVQIASYLLPIIFIGSAVLFFITKESIFSSLVLYGFVFNLIIAFSQFSKVKSELYYITRIEEIVKSYSLIIEKIELEDFQSDKLIFFKSFFNKNNVLASSKIHELSDLFNKLGSALNGFGAIILNGMFMYHVHIFSKISKWKKDNSQNVYEWIDVIGSFEALNSLANFSYNNPAFVFPDINADKIIEFKNLGHPLLNQDQRIDNDVSFSEQRFVILTGSNMSGKSTFLRSLGVNMVLAGTGAPVCASQANIHPMQILVSMRLMDSLEENESYFFAEVKRLKQIMDLLEKETSFVLLDEILRGTNSDDKRQGTIEVIKQMISKNAIGIIATHDLEVCKMTNDFKDVLANKCFEVEIVDDELSFDYKLREGICKNKSASFLMKKMKVI